MIWAKFFQGIENIKDCIEVRKSVLCDEQNQVESTLIDKCDEFAFNVVAYEDKRAVGTGRLLFKEGRYIIDKICVLNEYKENNVSDLIIRMLVRKAVTIGAEKVYSEVDEKYKSIFEKIGFKVLNNDKNNVTMIKHGDIRGHCCE